ncbi:MAG: isocitrate/isopropylmalate dehydrogenase family protein [Candidatus Thermoplasmatota archaeon]|nr:isocitrate/isopropylmalate dehydrogenase family protein [Candidatus Thermoplasmatota archaeon]
MPKKICVIPGDGIGLEVMESCLAVLDALKLDFEYVHADAGLACFKKRGEYIPDETIALAKSCDAVLMGAIQTPVPTPKDYKSPVLTLRRELDLFANVRPFRQILPNMRPLDIVLFRENTEDVYNCREYEKDGAVVSERVISRKGCERIVKFALDYAESHGRRKVTCIHKANVLKRSDGMFREIFYDLAKAHPSIKAEDDHVDAAAMHLVMNPARYDTIVTLNLYGDILSDEIAGLVGGLGFAPSANVGEKYALFEPVHGSAPDIAGKGTANPVAMILSACMMLRHFGYEAQAAKVESAIGKMLKDGKCTSDCGGKMKTKEFSKELIREIARR